MKRLETPRLVLRGWAPADAFDLYAYASHPEVGPGAGWKPHESEEESLAIIHEVFLKHNDCWAIEVRDTGRVVGSVGLHVDPSRPGVEGCRMLGYTLGRSVWGHGYATEAARAAIACGFEDMGLRMISVYHYPHNTASRRVVEKCGFVYEGTLRRSHQIFDGTVQDSRCYSMTPQEYAALKTAWRAGT